MGYNLNDCVELRWGAPDKSDEASTCKRHAPAAQRAKMTEYRAWFHERHWPHALAGRSSGASAIRTLTKDLRLVVAGSPCSRAGPSSRAG